MFLVVNFYPGHRWGNLKWVVLNPRGCSLLLDGEGRRRSQWCGSTEDGIGTSYAGSTQSGAERGGGGGRRGDVLPEGREEDSRFYSLSAQTDEQTPCFFLPTKGNMQSTSEDREPPQNKRRFQLLLGKYSLKFPSQGRLTTVGSNYHSH